MILTGKCRSKLLPRFHGFAVVVDLLDDLEAAAHIEALEIKIVPARRRARRPGR